MSKQHVFAGTVVLAIVFAGTFVSTQGRITSSATGSGHVVIADSLRTFAFNVNRDASGNARGQFEVNNRDQGIRSHGTLNCLNVVGNTAIMSGQVTDSTSAAWEDAYIWLKVVDNGEGRNAPPDMLTLVFAVAPTFTCNFDAAVPYLNVEKGNVQIRP